jgi:MFS_1 like family
MLILAHVVLLVRLSIYMFFPYLFGSFFDSGGNYIILLVEVCHGLAFGLYWSAGIQHLQDSAPKEFLQTYIGIYCSLSNNAGGNFT